MRNQPPCVTWAEKLALRREDLALADREAVDTHVQTCPACEAAQADYHFLDSRLRALPPPALKPLPRLSLQNLRQDEGERDTTKTMKAGGATSASRLSSPVKRRTTRGRFVFSVRSALPAVLVACLILAALLLFGMQSASINGSQPPGTTLFTYNGHSDYVDAVAWSPNGQFIASGSWDGTAQVWDARTGALLTTYRGHKNAVSALAWSPDGQYIASGSWDHTVQVWYAQTGETLFTYRGDTEFVDAVAWSPDGQYIASGDRNDTVQVWNVKTGKMLFERAKDTGGIIEALAWSPDGRYIAAGDRDKTVQILDARTGAILTIYKGHTDEVSALAWSPNSPYIASGSYDHTVQVWNAHTGATLFTYRGHSNTVAAVAWSANGRYIASGSWDGTVQVWAAPSTR